MRNVACFLVVLSWGTSGCSCGSGTSSLPDGGVRDDAAAPDARDASADSFVRDAGPLDAGAPDIGAPDAGPDDAGPDDAGPDDAGPPDAGPTDAGCDFDGDGHLTPACGGNDCDDGDPAVHPGAAESCNGVDDDCDTMVDEVGSSTFYRDVDGDGFGVAAMSVLSCTPPVGYVAAAGDCDDADAARHPAATEVCNALDDDCDTLVDETAPPRTYYRDVDGDGVGVGVDTIVASSCTPPGGYVAASGDCDDMNAAVGPGAIEVCNFVDDDCDGTADDGLTGFDDGFDGAVLDPLWARNAVGTDPTFTILSGILEITDASFAATPSMPANSWIYDYQQDLGNQMQRAAPIGAGDFALEVVMSFSSDVPQLTIGGVALVDATNHIELFAYAGDGSAIDPGGLSTGHRLAGPGIGGDWSTGLVGGASADFVFVRTGGQLRVVVDGVERAMRASTATLSAVSIVTVRHRAGPTVFEYGTVRIDRVRLCR